MKMDKPKLSRRLSCAAELCYDGSVADIGTDHALLPIFLVMDGHDRALASDIREGPAMRARENVEKYGLADKITVACRPGLDGIEEFAPENILICGMGGEMIASILAASDYPKSSRCRLVLQPQSMQSELRAYLCREGFSIDDERVVSDDGKYYQLISARYDAVVRTLDSSELKLGALNLARALENPTEDDTNWLASVKKSAEARLNGRKNARNELDNDADCTLIRRIDEILKKENENADC